MGSLNLDGIGPSIGSWPVVDLNGGSVANCNVSQLEYAWCARFQIVFIPEMDSLQ